MYYLMTLTIWFTSLYIVCSIINSVLKNSTGASEPKVAVAFDDWANTKKLKWLIVDKSYDAHNERQRTDHVFVVISTSNLWKVIHWTSHMIQVLRDIAMVHCIDESAAQK